MDISRKNWWKPFVFLAFPFAVYLIWVIIPIIQTFTFSFNEWNGMDETMKFIGFDNYSRLFGDSTFWVSLKNNMFWLIMFVIIPVPSGLLIAMLFDTKLPGGKVFKTLFYLSMTLSFVVIAQIWSWIFEPKHGTLTSIMKSAGFNSLSEFQNFMLNFILFVIIPISLGLIVAYLFLRKKSILNNMNNTLSGRFLRNKWLVRILYITVFLIIFQILRNYWKPEIIPTRLTRKGFPWLSDPDIVTFSLIGAALWRQIPYVMVLYLAGLKGIPPQLIEASIVDGASWRQRFWYIIIPQLKPSTVVALTISVIDSLRAFDIVYAMTRGGPFNSSSVLANFMYIETFNNYRMGYGSSIAVIQFLITFGFIFLYLSNVLKKEG